MKVTKIHVDSDPDMTQEQFEEWVGVHDSYEFDFGNIKLRATSWAESPKEVSIGWYELNGERKTLNNTLIGEREFTKVAKYLKELNIYEIYRFFNGSYPLIPEKVWGTIEST